MSSSVYVRDPNPVDVRTATIWLLKAIPGLQPATALYEARAALVEAHPKRLTHGASGYRNGHCRCNVCNAGERLHIASHGYHGVRCGTPKGYNKHIEKGDPPCMPCKVAAEAAVEMRVSKPALKPPGVYPQCGSPSGYTKHHRSGELVCPKCKEARDEYRAQRKQKKED